MPTSKQPPMLERGDTVYARHPRHGAVVVKVLAAGKDGYTAEDGGGARHKLLHDTYLGHQKRVIPTLKVVDQGADGMLVEDQRGQRRFVKGELPQPKPAEPSGNHTAAGETDDPLLDGLDILKKAFLSPMAPLPDGLVLMLKATGTPTANRPGLALRPITDSKGRRTSRWVKTSPDQKKGRASKKPDETTDPRTPHKDDRPVPPALHKHGDTVAFRHGNVEGQGKIVGSGADGVTVATEDGREHMVRHEHLLPDHPPPPKPKADGPADAKPSQEPVPPEHFKAAEVYAKADDPNVTPQSVLAEFPPDTAAKMRQAQLKLDGGQQTQDLYKKNGEYTPERQAVHDRIVKTFMSEAQVKAATPPEGTPPTFTILGGRGGSGKSWFEGNVFDPESAIVLDADKIKQALPEYEGWNAAHLHEESGDLFDKITKTAQDMGLNLVHDATMKTASKAVALVESFKAQGYRVEAHYMFLPRQEAAKRAVARFLGPTARLVPPEVILANTGNEKSFDAVKDMVDAWSFRDNNVGRGQQPILLSEKPDASEAGSDGRHGQSAATGQSDRKPVSGQAGRRSPGGGSGPFEGGHYGPASQAQKAFDPTR
jgi:predicted kinase